MSDVRTFSTVRSHLSSFFSSSRDSDNGESSDYVTHICLCGGVSGDGDDEANVSFKASTYLVCTLSDGSVRLFCLPRSPTEMMVEVHRVVSPGGGLAASFHSSMPPPSSSTARICIGGWDGSVRGYALDFASRSQPSSSPTFSIFVPGKDAVTSLTETGGTILIAGTEVGSIHFYDISLPSMMNIKLLGSYTEGHSDAITVLNVHPNNPNVILSGSEDGTVILHDISAPDEEKAFMSVLNVGCPVRRAGFFGKGWEGIWCTTGSEGVQVWHWSSGIRISNYESLKIESSGENESISCGKINIGGVRDCLNKILDQEKSHHGENCGRMVEYLLGCHYNVSSERLSLLAGSHGGYLVAFELGSKGETKLMAETSSLPLSSFRGTAAPAMHQSTIRDFVVLGEGIVTGGEDGRICEWQVKDFPTIDQTTSQEAITALFFPMNNPTQESRLKKKVREKRKERKNGRNKGSNPY
mmetsp:Transcript_11468/g.25149  ORF Transcript_11468/g.25149 Transcript_11468/m.25149 type:complete len:469 (-) Transcript_11468:226-1632(-)